ncbi:MAG: bifunctional 4-hydroxy-3-methylbut-2-enyl diphosphate reductase/30S ribosomal protein S1 [Clostridia bacterium]
MARSAGFCFGVERAVALAERLAQTGKPAVTLGPLIHNPGVVDALSKRGIVPIDRVEDAPTGATVLIRSHGVGRGALEALRERANPILDATCPFVRRIHQMALDAAQSNLPVIVVGDGEHPEVQGILGWTLGKGVPVLTEAEIDALAPMESALVVSQTTLPKAKYDHVCARLREKIGRLDIRQTICTATERRQTEAEHIARNVDVMLVVGGRNSANTRKLYELCGALCPQTYFIETAAELDQLHFSPRGRIGMTAGASTPVCTFKEVVTRMNDIEKQEQAEAVGPIVEPTSGPAVGAAQVEAQETTESSADDDFMASVDRTLVQLRPGQTVTGTVLQITDDEVCVNVGYKADGLIKKADLSSTDVKVGDEIEVEVVKVNDGEGNVLLSQRNIVNKKSWDEIVAKFEAGECVTGVGKEAVKGGLTATVLGIRAFIPASQLSQHYVEKISDFVGQEMKLKIIEVEKTKKRIVASRKAVLQAEESERKKEIWDTLEVGQVVNGIVRRLTDFGAFVDIGGVDGLVHVTDLAWHRVKHPSEVVQVKQEIQVKILNMDKEKERISLSYKQTQPRPWDVAGEKYAVGSVVTGKVVRITTFGAFVELEPGLDGLVHISQCALTRIAKVEDAVNVGDVIRVKILDVNTEARRISLSIRAVLEDEALDNLGEMSDVADEFAIEPAYTETVETVEVTETPEA